MVATTNTRLEHLPDGPGSRGELVPWQGAVSEHSCTEVVVIGGEGREGACVDTQPG